MRFLPWTVGVPGGGHPCHDGLHLRNILAASATGLLSSALDNDTAEQHQETIKDSFFSLADAKEGSFCQKNLTFCFLICIKKRVRSVPPCDETKRTAPVNHVYLVVTRLLPVEWGRRILHL